MYAVEAILLAPSCHHAHGSSLRFRKWLCKSIGYSLNGILDNPVLLNMHLIHLVLAAIGPSDGLKQVAIRVGKIDATPPKMMIDCPG